MDRTAVIGRFLSARYAAHPFRPLGESMYSTARREWLRASGTALLSYALGGIDAAASPQARRARTSLEARLTLELPALMARHKVPGVSMAAWRNGQMAWARGLGVADAQTRSPVDTSTVFAAQSMSKPVFAYAVMQLHERGLLTLDTPLVTYLPGDIVEGDPRSRRLTARHVLSHTTGLPNWRSGPLRFDFDPGERWQYSGEGYAYLQRVVTHLTGATDARHCGRFEGDVEVCATDIDRYLKQQVLTPMGMASSGYVWAAGPPRRARPRDAEGRALPVTPATAVDAARYAAAGGLFATPSDYARFLGEVVAPRGSDAHRLSARTLAEMRQPVAKVPDDTRGSAWALGWQVFPTADGPVIAHGGDGRGEHSFAFASPAHKAAFVIMTNGDGGARIIGTLIDRGVSQLVGP